MWKVFIWHILLNFSYRYNHCLENNHNHHCRNQLPCRTDVAVPKSTLHACQTNVKWCDSGFNSPAPSMTQFWSLGKGATLDLRSMDGSTCALWLKNLRQVVQMTCVSGGRSVRRRSSSFKMWSFQEIHSTQSRHHQSNVSMFLDSCRVGDHVSAP